MTEIIKENYPLVFDKISECLTGGGVIIYPTETLYGIGCLAFNQETCRRIVKIKRRSEERGLIVLVSDKEMLDRHFHVPAELLERYSRSQKPLTLILHPKSTFPEEVSGGRDSVAVRISTSPFVKEVLRRVGEPITSTSANISGRGNSNRFIDIRRDFPSGIDVIVDSGTLPSSTGSAIVNLTTMSPEIIREGDLSITEIEKILYGRDRTS